MSKVIDDRASGQVAYEDLRPGQTFLCSVDLYIITDEMIEGSSTFKAVNLVDGSATRFMLSYPVTPVHVEHHIVNC